MPCSISRSVIRPVATLLPRHVSLYNTVDRDSTTVTTSHTASSTMQLQSKGIAKEKKRTTRQTTNKNKKTNNQKKTTKKQKNYQSGGDCLLTYLWLVGASGFVV